MQRLFGNVAASVVLCLSFASFAYAQNGTGATGAGGIPIGESTSGWFDSVSQRALHEGPARFLPGNYLFKKGNEYYRRGDANEAVDLWTVASYWAQKGAQYNLGILYFKGDSGLNVVPDRALGVAWLALAAERHDAVFESSLAAAMADLDDAEKDRANALWRGLKTTFADNVAARRARQHFDREVRTMTGSRTGSVAAMPLRVYSLREGSYDGSQMLAKQQQEADEYFGAVKSWVDVKPLIPADEAPKQKPDGSGDPSPNRPPLQFQYMM